MLERRRAFAIVSSLVLASLFSVQPAGAGNLPPLANLAPGTDLRIQQTVDVNVVLVGFGGLADPAAVLAEQLMPQWNGVPKANGQGQTFIGQRFDFRYNVIAAPTWFDDLLFPLLRQSAVPQNPLPIFQGLPPLPISLGQALYNYCNVDPAFDPTLGCSFDPAAPRVNRRMITQNYLLHAAFVEKVLSQNLPVLLGVDVTRPTVVVLNWWGRPDYIDHIYLDPSEPDPETGAPRGLFIGNELGGYGGTAPTDAETCRNDCIFHRLWFYDISAGPMLRTGGFDLVARTPRFIGAPDFHQPFPSYRFHHTADYGTPGAYRPIEDPAGDVAALAGFVYLSQIAYAGPLYPPALTPPTLPRRLVLDINRWSWSGQSFAGLLDVPRMLSKMSVLPYDIAVEIKEQPQGPESDLGRVWKCSLTSVTQSDLGQSCFGNRTGGYAFGDVATYFTNHLNQYLTGAPDYEVPIFQFNVPPELAQPVWTAIAFDNYLLPPTTPVLLPDNRQTFVFSSSTPFVNSIFGHGQQLQHEVGHHLGFSHPFQGYLCVTDRCGCLTKTCDFVEFFPFGANAGTYFAQSGLYVTGLMSYVSVNNDYSRFELDNLQRWLTWEYIDLSNFILSQIAASPHSGTVAAAVTQADALAGSRSPSIATTTTRRRCSRRAPPIRRWSRRPRRSTCASRPRPIRPCVAIRRTSTSRCDNGLSTGSGTMSAGWPAACRPRGFAVSKPTPCCRWRHQSRTDCRAGRPRR
jgi:hypothetical protein